jgi:hypothetical protein
MRRYRAWLIAALLSGAWAGAALLAGREFVSDELGHRYQYVHAVRADAPPWEAGLTLPFYEIFRSPAAEKLPTQFTWFGYQGVDDWNLHLGSRQWNQIDFPDGNTLYLEKALSDADQAYVKQQFWAQRGARQAEWNRHMRPWFAVAAMLPALLFGLLGLRALLRRMRARA